MVNELSRQIEEIEAKERKGSYGIWRKKFCGRYFNLLIKIQNDSYNSLLKKLITKNERIACRKGCIYCCLHYVTVSVAQGIVIVNYLYERNALLNEFVNNYRKWCGKGHSISNRIDQIRMQGLSSSLPMDRILDDTRPLSERYRELSIECPFLRDRKCLIYPVRPLSCSGHYSVSPPAWCSAGERQNPVIHYMIPSDEDLCEMIRLTDARLILYELALPVMIYRILTEGSQSVMTEIMQYSCK